MLQVPSPTNRDDRRTLARHYGRIRSNKENVFGLFVDLTGKEAIIGRLDVRGEPRDLRYRFYNTMAIGLVVMGLYLGAFVIDKYSVTFKGFQPPLGRWPATVMQQQ